MNDGLILLGIVLVAFSVVTLFSKSNPEIKAFVGALWLVVLICAVPFLFGYMIIWPLEQGFKYLGGWVLATPLLIPVLIGLANTIIKKHH